MSKTLKSYARNIGTKLLMALLVMTFAVWGIGDMVRQSNEGVVVATVGDMEIPYREYRRSLYVETERVRQMLGKQFSPDIAKRLGLGSRVLKNLIDNRLLKLEVERIGLRISDRKIAETIQKNPDFLDKEGKFSKKTFELMLRRSGQTEKKYVEQLRSDIAINLLLNAILSPLDTPENAEKTLYSARKEKRKIDIYTLPASLIESVPEPNEKQLKQYYEKYAAEFTVPEYRTTSYVTLTPDDAKKYIVSSNAKEPSGNAIKKMYEERIDEFKKQERRLVKQLLFGNKDAAQKAYNEIQSGKTFATVAKNANILNPDAISLGLIEKSNILEDAADAVFSLKTNDVSKPIESAFGWHVFQVTKIVPAMTQPLHEVSTKLEKELEQKAAEEAMIELSNKLEDSIAGGSTLAEAAKELGLKTTSLPAVDKDGKLENGESAKTFPKYEDFLEIAFKTEEKTESPLVANADGSNYILRVDDITPKHVRPFEEVKPKLVEKWKAREKGYRFFALAKKMSNAFSDGDKRAAIIQKYSLSSPVATTISQQESGANALPSELVVEIFSKTVDESTRAFKKKDSDGYVIAVLKDIILPQHDPQDAQYQSALSDIKRAYKSAMHNEIIEQYLHALKKKYPVSVNEAALQIKSDN